MVGPWIRLRPVMTFVWMNRNTEKHSSKKQTWKKFSYYFIRIKQRWSSFRSWRNWIFMVTIYLISEFSVHCTLVRDIPLTSEISLVVKVEFIVSSPRIATSTLSTIFEYAVFYLPLNKLARILVLIPLCKQDVTAFLGISH